MQRLRRLDGKIDGNDQQMIMVTKHKFDAMRQETMNIRSSSSKNAISAQSSEKFHSFANVEKIFLLNESILLDTLKDDLILLDMMMKYQCNYLLSFFENKML